MFVFTEFRHIFHFGGRRQLARNAKIKLNETNCINDGKTIDVNKINKLYN